MTQWRIRVAVPDAPAGRRALRRALAQAPGTVVHLDPLGVDVAETSGDVSSSSAKTRHLGICCARCTR
jgi:hypothetical protein